MNCTETTTRLHQYLDEDFSAQEQQQFEEHISRCDSCQNELNTTRELRRVLAELPVEPARAGFEQCVLEEVHRHYPERQHHGFVTGFAAAVAASLMLWVASLMFFQQDVSNATVVTLTVNQERTVRLMFEAVGDMGQVTLSLNFPEHVELAGYPGKSHLSWQTRLQKGSNVLMLPILAVDQGEGEMIAQLNYGDKSKTFRILMKTTDDGVMNYVIQPVPLV
jgi:Putative zinc-finger